MLGNQEIEHGVAQELQPLVVVDGINLFTGPVIFSFFFVFCASLDALRERNLSVAYAVQSLPDLL